MHKYWFFIIFIVLTFESLAQKKITPLPPEVVESSALIKCKNTFLTLNDSGNKAKVYVFNKMGKIQHTCFIENASNIDWEAMAYDGEEFLYIADIGNNDNERK